MMEYELEEDMDFTTVVGHLKIFLSKLRKNWKIISNEEEGTIIFQTRACKNSKQLNQVTQDLARQDVKEKVENKAVLSVSSKIYNDFANESDDNICHEDDDNKHKFVEKEVVKDEVVLKTEPDVAENVPIAPAAPKIPLEYNVSIKLKRCNNEHYAKRQTVNNLQTYDKTQNNIDRSRILRSIKLFPNGPKCNDCGKHFFRQKKLDMHLKRRAEFKCYLCFQNLCTVAAAAYHAANVHGQLDFYCDKCDFKGKTKSHLNCHIKSIHDPPKHQCPECPCKFTRLITLNLHRSNAHGLARKTLSCPHCPKTFLSFAGHIAHIKSIHEKIKYHCDKCSKSFLSKRYLEDHIAVEHEMTKSRKLQCPDCPKMVVGKAKLEHHRSFAHRNGGVKCPICGRRFAEKNNLKRHIRVIHKSD